jgi:putative flippase GtrA
LKRQLASFAIAGAAGFVVDAGILYAALACGLGPFWGRAISYLCAIFTTWVINRTITFRPPEGRGLLAEFAHYLAATSVGAVANYGVYSAAILVLPHAVWAPLFAVAAGVGVGMVFNFVTTKFWVFRHREG